MDESPKQLIAETKIPIPASPGQPAKHDYEYRRAVCAIFFLLASRWQENAWWKSPKEKPGRIGLIL